MKLLSSVVHVFMFIVMQLIVINVTNGRQTVIPSLQSSDESIPAISPCGIHAISINPSGTLLATGASNTNDIGIYRLPTFDPVCVGEVSCEKTICMVISKVISEGIYI